MSKENARSVYADIIDLPYHQSITRKHMSLYDRTAQFASYKALSGYEDMVAEESRTVDGEIELSENEIDLINAMIGEISDRITNGDHPIVTVTYFKPDRYKKGGPLFEHSFHGNTSCFCLIISNCNRNNRIIQ